MKVKRLDHVVFAVRELEAAAAAWARAFDLQAAPPVRPPNAAVELAALPLEGQAGGAFLELARATAGDHPVARHVAERGEGMLSISFEVADLDAAVADLRANGVTISDPEPGLRPNTRVARLPGASAHGVAVQLIERQRS